LKNFTNVGHALLDGHLSHIGRGLDAEDGDAFCHKILKKVSVVAGELDNKAVQVKADAFSSFLSAYKRWSMGKPLSE